MKSFVRYNWPSISWAAFILVICLMPSKDLPKVEIINIDKVVHMGVYAVLSLLTYYGWTRQSAINSLQQHTFIKILLLLSAYGFAVEILQETCTADRHFDLYDALANAIGAVLGTIAARYSLPYKQNLS